MGKPEGRNPLERPWCRWENNTKMCLKEVSWQYVDWITVAVDKVEWRGLVNTVMKLQLHTVREFLD